MDPQGSTRPLAPRQVPRQDPRPLVRPVPRLSVVVVNYRQWRDTAELVRQLHQFPAFRRGSAEVVVVDNASPPHPIRGQLRRLPGVGLRLWRRNRGFARAVNEGCRLALGEWLLLLNPDVALGPGFLDQVVSVAERRVAADPELGLLGFRLRDPDGGVQRSTGPFPTFTSTLARLLLPRALRKYDLFARAGPRAVDWVTGCCLLIRRSCWEDLGGFDPAFFLYYEDVDLCRRARLRGWKVGYEPMLSAAHHRPLQAREVSPHLRLVTRHALLTYARKHWPAWQAHLLARIVRVESLARSWLAWLQGHTENAATFTEIGHLAADYVADRPDLARRRLRRAVVREEESRAIADGHHPEP
jgi:N-acetylglucosaminyl-diphospho-decaprenol L-rhamnosyltransferase